MAVTANGKTEFQLTTQDGQTDEVINVVIESCDDLDGDGNKDVKITAEVDEDSFSGTEDIVRFLFNYNNVYASSVGGITITDITPSGEESFDVDFNSNYVGLGPYDAFVEFGDGFPDNSTAVNPISFVITAQNDTDLLAGQLLNGENAYARLRSTDGGEESAKTLGTLEAVDCLPEIDLSGTKYTDITGNGITDDDTGLGGVTIFVDLDNSGTLSDGDESTTTADDGTWSITGLDPFLANGKNVLEITPDGYVQTAGGGTVDGAALGDTSADYNIDQTFDFANFELFDISGTKYTDITGNGITDDDTGLGGVTIFVDLDNSGTLSDGDESTTTADDGTWSITGLDWNAAGAAILEVTPDGSVQTAGDGQTVVGTSGSDQTGVDFANFELFDISGTKYTDTNGDGLTAGDSGLGGVTIFVDLDGNGTLSDGDELTTTADDGTWSFTDLDQTYAGKTVYEVAPSGYTQTLGAAGYEITGTSGTDQTGLDFANFELFDISGTKYQDLGADGTAGENLPWSGLGALTIFIDLDGNGTLSDGDESTTTADDGTWSFTDLDQTYAGKTVYEVSPDGYFQTVPAGEGGYTIVGTSGTDQTGLDFYNAEEDDGDDDETPPLDKDISNVVFYFNADGLAEGCEDKKGSNAWYTVKADDFPDAAPNDLDQIMNEIVDFIILKDECVTVDTELAGVHIKSGNGAFDEYANGDDDGVYGKKNDIAFFGFGDYNTSGDTDPDPLPAPLSDPEERNEIDNTFLYSEVFAFDDALIA